MVVMRSPGSGGRPFLPRRRRAPSTRRRGGVGSLAASNIDANTRPPVQANQAWLAPVPNGVVSLVRSALNPRPGSHRSRWPLRAAQTPRSRPATPGAFSRWRRPRRHSCGASPKGVDHHDHSRRATDGHRDGPVPCRTAAGRRRPSSAPFQDRSPRCPRRSQPANGLASTRRRAPGLLLRPRDDSPARRRAERRPAGAAICRFDSALPGTSNDRRSRQHPAYRRALHTPARPGLTS
jgi:hypothetical protein